MIFSSLLLSLILSLPAGLSLPTIQTVAVQSVEQDALILDDSLGVAVRRPPADVLEEFRADRNFQYAINEVRADSWWDQLKARFFRWLDDLFRDTGQGSYWRFVLYGAAILGFVFAVLQIYKMDSVRLFQKRTRRPGSMYEGISEVLQENDFLKMAHEAVENNDYREGARMYYMHVLRVLDEQGDIIWAPRKTNRDYVRECRQQPFRPAFERLTYLFDYSWYGNFPVDRQLVDEMQRLAAQIEATQQGVQKTGVML